MIDDKAVEAAARALDPGIWDQKSPGYTRAEVESFHYRRRKSAEQARDALQAALPVLLEGKAEEIARVIDPEAWDGGLMMSPPKRNKLRRSSLAKADRIISILTGGQDDR